MFTETTQQARVQPEYWTWVQGRCFLMLSLGVCLRAFIVVLNHHNQKQLGNKRLNFPFFFPCYSSSSKGISEGTQGRNLEARTEVEIIEEGFLLACSLWLTQLCFLMESRTSKPVAASPSLISYTKSVISLENTLEALSESQSEDSIF